MHATDLHEENTLMSVKHHALVLNLHQPLDNLEYLLAEKPWEAREILYAYDRIPRFLWAYEDIARIHLSLSGSLLETLSSPRFQHETYGLVDCSALLWHLQNKNIIEILGTGYYYPVLPLIPKADWQEQLSRWQGIARHLFREDSFQGFWPPEMGFAMELIPVLKQLGYRYVMVDGEHVRSVTPMTEAELLYRPHVARHGDEEIVVIVRDRQLSNAMATGMNYEQFAGEVAMRTQDCATPPLVTTCCDGENGPWFRNTHEETNFWGGFYGDLLKAAREQGEIHPIFIHDYLERYGVLGEVTVNTGAWNTEWHDGQDFGQWSGSPAQQKALRRLEVVSREVHDAIREANQREVGGQEQSVLEEAHWRLLRAETSCNFYWGEDWVNRANRDLDDAEATLSRFRAKKYQIDPDPGWHTNGSSG
jgi:alpha-amylase/alpha-mannosidase (GH57 family)